MKKAETVENVMAPSPGAYRRVDQLRTGLMTHLTLVTQEVNEIDLESLLQCGPITDGTPFEPGSKLGDVRGWFQLKQYSQGDNAILVIEQYGIMTLKALKAENKQVKPQIDVALLYNALATGTSTPRFRLKK